MDTRFHDSLLLSPPILLGERLRPLSIGHHLILTRIRSPFILGGPVRLDDCLLLIGICRRNFVAARAWILDQPAQVAEAERLGQRCSRVVGRALSPRAPLPDGGNLPATDGSASRPYPPEESLLPDLVRHITEYVAAYINLPELWKDPQPAKPTGLPIHLQLVAAIPAALCCGSALPGATGWDYPFGLAYWHLLEKTGSAEKIVTADQRGRIAKLKAKYAADKAAGKLPAPGEIRHNPKSKLPLYAWRRDRPPAVGRAGSPSASGALGQSALPGGAE